ncbi:MAG TPA: hypothetical protein VGG10_05755 [Rhizomicrobium sp.]
MAPGDRESYLEPGRTCGTCTVCCVIPAIDTPELQKTTSVACVHCKEGSGCRIYDTRPPGCREYYCYWRYKTNLNDSWRPDLSGVYINALDEPAPEGYGGPPVELRILWPSVLEWPPFTDVVAEFVRLNIAVYLSIPGPEGHNPVRTILNPMVSEAVKRGDRLSMRHSYVEAMAHLLAHETQPVAFQYGAPNPV